MCEKMSRREAGRLGGIAARESIAKRRSLFVEKYNVSPKLCEYCNEIISYDKRRNKFCSQSCAASYNNQGVQRNPSKRDMRLKPCLFCNKITKNEKCCSRSCSGKLKRQELNEKIKNGQYFYLGSGQNAAKRFVIEERGEACESCKRKKWLGKKIILSLHHVDGDASNNLPDNLQLLCWNCHSMTPNFGGKNKKSTRVNRYKKQ